MKKLSLMLMLSAFFFSSYAQEKFIQIADRINATDYIFEGVVLKTHPYKTTDQKKIYTSNVIQITKIFKGNDKLGCGTIELITEGGDLPDLSEHGSHSLEMKKGDQGVFLCNENNRELPASYFPFTVPTKVGAKFEWQSFIKYLYEYNNLKAYDLWGVYDSVAQLYNLTELLTQISYIDCDDGHLLPPPIHSAQVYQPDPMPHYSRADGLVAIDRIAQQKALHTRPKISRSTETLNYTMSNITITGTSPKYLEYDINLSDATPNHYLATADVRIVYDPAVFGQYVVNNNKIMVTPGPLANTSCYFAIVPVDDNPHTLEIPVGAHDYSICKSLLQSYPQQLVHIKMEIQTCGLNSEINIADTTSFIAPSFMASSSAYSQSSGDSLLTFYDAVTVDSAAVPGCSAHINSFDPPTVNGGVGDILNIHGYQFGANRGNGNLYFFNANNPLAGMNTPLDSLDYISWSDTFISIRVPSIDSGGSRLPIGSGYFRILTNVGDSSTSSSALTVFYSLTNTFDSSSKIKCPVYLTNNSGMGGYQFFVDTSVSHNAAIYGCVQKAVQDWVCASGVNFVILRDTFGISDTSMLDGINLIIIGPQQPNTLATCYSYQRICSDGVTCLGYFKEKDIVISNAPGLVWFTDTTGALPVPSGQSDLYHVLLHELGHGVGHNHIIDPTKIMNYAIPLVPPTGLPAIQRVVNIRVDASASDGGVKEVDNSSLSSNFLTGCYGVPMVPEYICVIVNSINYINASNLNIVIYPNPFGEILNIVSDQSIIKVYLSSIDGKIIENWTYDHESKVSLQLPASLSSGFYLIKIQTQNGFITKKLIHE